MTPLPRPDPEPEIDPASPEYRDAWLSGQVPDDGDLDMDELLSALRGALGHPQEDA